MTNPEEAAAARTTPREITISAAWHAGNIGPELTTVDGIPLQVIHRGTWSHGLGPDFRDVLILFNGRELRSGSVEMHLSTRGWFEHGHDLDPRYESVILHVVEHHDGTQTRRLDGGIVPIVQLASLDQFEIPDFAGWDWDRVGGQVCANHFAATAPVSLRDILNRLGDVRLAARAARMESRLPSEPAGQILWEELLDGLGFSANREPMRALARIVKIAALESQLGVTPSSERAALAHGILLGAAGFLPLSPAEAHLGRLSMVDLSQLEASWLQHGDAWKTEQMSSTSWNRARVRPANHPVARLIAAANFVVAASREGGLLSAILDIVQQESNPVEPLRQLSASASGLRIGVDRALDILTSGIIPFALGLASYSGNMPLLEAATGHWERLPAPAVNAVTRRAKRQVAGSTPLAKIGARGSQGLIHLDTVLCQARRCFECPVAAAELAVKG